MRPLQTDLSIYSKFNFEHQPAAIKYLFYKPEGIEPLDKSLALCEILAEAQKRPTPFYITREIENCHGGDVFGMNDERLLEARSGILGYKMGQFQEPRANMLLVSRQYPNLSSGTVNYVVFSLLDKVTFDPDLIIFMADTSQAEILLRALAYSNGELYESKMSWVLSCSWLFAYPFLSGKVNYIVTGLGHGPKARQVFPDGWFLISVPFNWIPTITRNLEEMEWVLPAYTLGREKFLEWSEKRREQITRESQNP